MTLYLPTDEESLEGIGPWNDDTDCPSTFAGKRCALPAGHNGEHAAPITLAAFEQDRYARLLAYHGHSTYALLSGSIGSTNVAQAW